MLGIFAAATGLTRLDSVKKAIADVVPAEIREKNIAGAEAGFEAVQN
jgi:Pyruvate/2-oxoacid:ferredoxin oxidoreductase gamma subunit